MVVDAGRENSPTSEQALAALCETYWYPLYAFVRRQGYQPAEAQDLTQGFFARLLEKRDFSGVDREKGRFRAFLLASMKHYLMNAWDKERAAKRGGGRRMLSVEFDVGESRYSLEPHHQRTAEVFFDREWALTMLERVRSRLAAEHPGDRCRQYERLQAYLTGEPNSTSYREVGEELGMNEGAVKVAVHRLRRRFRELLREQIAQTVATEAEIDDEIAALFEALRGS
jgi:RNA polymerase sigma-70 factor (ECF subfamily)